MMKSKVEDVWSRRVPQIKEKGDCGRQRTGRWPYLTVIKCREHTEMQVMGDHVEIKCSGVPCE